MPHARLLWIIALMPAALAAQTPQPEPHQIGPVAAPHFRALGDLQGGFFDSRAYAVSDDGTRIVGSSDAGAEGSLPCAWSPVAGPLSLPLPEEFNAAAYAFGISGDGATVVGTALLGQPPKTRYSALHWEGTADPVSHDAALTPPSQLDDASYDGTILVGTDFFGFDFDPAFWSGRALLWHVELGVTYLPDLGPGPGFYPNTAAFAISNDGTIIVGTADDSIAGVQAVRWIVDKENISVASLGFVPGGSQPAAARALNDDGSVIVGHCFTAGGFVPFRWTEQDGMVNLGSPPPERPSSSATVVSGDGRIVLGADVSGPYPYFDETGRAWMWDAAHGMRDFKSYLQNEQGLALNNWLITHPTDMTPDGRTVVGIGINPNGAVESWAITIPCWHYGDFNIDFHTDGRDIQRFVDCLIDSSPDAPCACADMDHDGVVAPADLSPFVARLLSP